MLPVWLFMVLIAIICYLLFRSISEETFFNPWKKSTQEIPVVDELNQGAKKEI